jgi:large subunit ribosomal protein L32e
MAAENDKVNEKAKKKTTVKTPVKKTQKTAKAKAKKAAKKEKKREPEGSEDEEYEELKEAGEDDDVEIIDEDLEEELEEEYIVKQKPELTPELKKMLKIRKNAKKKKPKFKRQEWFRYKRLGDSWRKPRGLQSKLRTNRKYRINRVKVGYKTAEGVRGLHSSGFKERLVYNKSDLDKLDPKLEAARIGHSVGTRKRIEIEEHADELGIRILNRG